MGSLIVGFYWLLYTPFAGFMAQKDNDIQFLQLMLTEMGQKGFLFRKIAHNCSGAAVKFQFRGRSMKKRDRLIFLVQYVIFSVAIFMIIA